MQIEGGCRGYMCIKITKTDYSFSDLVCGRKLKSLPQKLNVD